MLVASYYLPQRPLIGGVLLPICYFILKLVILSILPPVFILVVGPATVLSWRDPSLALIEAAWTLPRPDAIPMRSGGMAVKPTGSIAR
jgi:hypothetical protein